MNKMQRQLIEFHDAMGHANNMSNPQAPLIVTPDLRIELIEEEVMKELIPAIRAGDMVHTIDGACDALYVIIGSMVAFGVDIEPFFDEVHRSNMAKIGGPVSLSGKKLKPLGWQPPRIAEMLQELRRQAIHTRIGV